MKIELVDYFIVLIFLAFLFYVGYRCKQQMHSASDFFLVAKKLPAWVIAVSLFSLGLTSFDVIGLSALTADHGIISLHYFWMGTIPALAFLIFCVIPVFAKAQIKNLPDYLHRRFDSDTRRIGACIYILIVCVFCALNLFLGSKALSFFCPLPQGVWITILAAIAAGYVALGGLSAAILNSVLLVSVIVFALTPLSVLGIAHFGDWNKMVIELMDKSYFEIWKPLLGLNSLGVKWELIFTGLSLSMSLGLFALDYSVVQRVQSLDDANDAKKAVITTGWLRMLSPLIIVFPALVTVAAVPSLKLFDVKDADSGMLILPILMGNWYTPGMFGICVAAFIASVLCSLQAGLMVFSTAVFSDIQNATGYAKVVRAQKLTVAGAAIFAALALLLNQFPGSSNYVQTIFTFIGVPLCAVTICGMFISGCTSKGAKAGILGGVIIAFLHYGCSILSSISPNLLPAGIGSLIEPLKSHLAYFGFRSAFASNLSRAFFVFIGSIVIALLFSGKQDKTDSKELDLLTFHISSVFARENRMVLLSTMFMLIVLVLLNVGLW
ncbi:MAG: hypothetical protein SFY67_13910 [Candidatus Melainabacteria bacterium]|nr:hypothetical protein [Candidatus Melainabacteria bacterium]